MIIQFAKSQEFSSVQVFHVFERGLLLFVLNSGKFFECSILFSNQKQFCNHETWYTYYYFSKVNFYSGNNTFVFDFKMVILKSLNIQWCSRF